VAMVVRGQRVTVILRVTREARDLLRRGSAVRIDGADEGEGIDEGHLPRLTGWFCRVGSRRSRVQGGRGWGWPP
jgi:two-component system phosphate regulon sensor histidine kinase PhoR